MRQISLEEAISFYPVVWFVGEPALAYNRAVKTLGYLVNDKGRRIPVDEWTYPLGWKQDATDLKPKSRINADMELIEALLKCESLVVQADGVTFGPQVVQACDAVVNDDRRVVFVSNTHPPADFLTDYICVVEITYDSMETTIKNNCDKNKRDFIPEMVPAVSGLNPFRASTNLLSSFALADKGKDIEFLYGARAEGINRDSAGVVTLEEPDENFDCVVGLERAKRLLTALSTATVKGQPVRGALLLGIPGTGKTMIARSIAGERRMPLYIFDIGSVFGSLVGESEAKIKRSIQTVKQCPPGILLVDEIEKGLSGSSRDSYSGDSGTARRAGGYILQYMNDPKANGGYHLILGTSNDVEKLPAEFVRAGRWDAMLWFGLPKEDARRKVLSMYRERYGLKKTFGNEADLKAFTPAEIESVCRVASVLNTQDWGVAEPFVPVLARARPEDVARMIKWAKTRAVPADD